MAKRQRESEKEPGSVTMGEGDVATADVSHGDESSEGSDVQPDAADSPSEVEWLSQAYDELKQMVHERDTLSAPPPAVFRPLQELQGSDGALHAIHMRLVEMVPFLPAAIEETDGVMKTFLEMLMSLLKP